MSICFGWCERSKPLPPIVFTPRSMTKRRRAGRDQPLKGSNLIGKATLNVLEPGGSREITGVEEERLHVYREHISVTEEVSHLR